MIADDTCDSLVRTLYQSLASRPLAELLLQYGLLRQLIHDACVDTLRDSVVFTPEEQPLLLTTLWDGVPVPPPGQFEGDWLATLPQELQGPVGQRWNQIRLQKWLDERYADRVEPYFLERRRDLEQVVYRMIRLRQQGKAEEIYLRLLDDDADFGDLAFQHSSGDERYTNGLVGPMLVTQPHQSIRAALDTMAVGDIHPPFRVEQWILLLQLLHRLPATLNDNTRASLQQELLKSELDVVIDGSLRRVYPELNQSAEAITLPHG